MCVQHWRPSALSAAILIGWVITGVSLIASGTSHGWGASLVIPAMATWAEMLVGGSLTLGTDLHMGRLVATEIQSGGDQTTIADVYGYALATYKPTPRPGENPAAVLDSMIFDVIDTIDAEAV